MCLSLRLSCWLQDTLRASPPENKSMKKATFAGIATTTTFYVLCGCVGYAAFGNNAPGNFLTGFGFYEPFWLIDFANVCIAVHLIGAYQVSLFRFFNFVSHFCALFPKACAWKRKIVHWHHLPLAGLLPTHIRSCGKVLLKPLVG